MTASLCRAVRNRLRALLGDGDRGSAVLVWFVMTAPVLLLLAVLVFDGGAKLKAGEQASHYSAEAARAASIAVGPFSSAGDLTAAVRAAQSYLAAAGVRGSVSVTGPATVTVSATVSRTAPISGVTFTISRTTTARLLVGVERGQAP